MKVDAERAEDPDRDRFVLSKGHCVEGHLNILADKGFIEKEELKILFVLVTGKYCHPIVFWTHLDQTI